MTVASLTLTLLAALLVLALVAAVLVLIVCVGYCADRQRHLVEIHRTRGELVETLHEADEYLRCLQDDPPERGRIADEWRVHADLHERSHALLGEVEWSAIEDLEEGGYAPACPVCGVLQSEGQHFDDCRLATLRQQLGDELIPF